MWRMEPLFSNNSLCNFYFCFLLLCWVGDTLWHLQKFLQCINYIILEFTPSTILLYPPPIPGIIPTGIVFAFTYMCTQYLHHIHLLHSFKNRVIYYI
jgi:hypothetical protein